MNILLLCFVVAFAATDVTVNDSVCTEHDSEEPSASSVDRSVQEVESGGVVLLSKREVLSKAVFNHDVSETKHIEKETHTGGDGMVFSATSALASLTNWTHRATHSLLSAIAAPSSRDVAETSKGSSSGTLFLLLVAVCGMVLACLVWQLQGRNRKHEIYEAEEQEEEWKNEAWVKGDRMQNPRDLYAAHLAAHLAQGGQEDGYRGSDTNYQDAWMRGPARSAAAPASSSHAPQQTWVAPSHQLMNLGIESGISRGAGAAASGAGAAVSTAAAAARSTGELAGNVAGDIGHHGQKVVHEIDKKTGKVLKRLTNTVSHAADKAQNRWEEARARSLG